VQLAEDFAVGSLLFGAEGRCRELADAENRFGSRQLDGVDLFELLGKGEHDGDGFVDAGLVAGVDGELDSRRGGRRRCRDQAERKHDGKAAEHDRPLRRVTFCVP
jgi:hypothetical protein